MRDKLEQISAGAASRIEKDALRLVADLFLLIKLAGIHEPGNEALQAPLKDFAASVGRLLELDPAWEIRIMHGHIFAGSVRLRIETENFASYVGLLDELGRRGVGVIAMERVPDEGEVLRFLYRLQRHEGARGIEALRAALEEEGLDFIRVEESRKGEPRESRGRMRQYARETFFSAIHATSGILREVDRQEAVSVRRVRRMVQSFLELLNMDEGYLIGLTSIKNYDDYTFNHSVNVAVLALNVGRRLGFSRSQLGDLGLAAIFHDLGKTSLPSEIIRKRGRLDGEEWKSMHRHPEEGVRKLINLKGVSEVTVKLLLSVHEHHVNFDYTGYPEVPMKEQASLYPRVLRIVDSYDAMTSPRPYAPRPKHPVAALEEIWSLAGRDFDPDLVKVFIRMMGIYPVGTVVQLSTGDPGIVVGIRREGPGVPLPVVERIRAGGVPGSPGERVDVAPGGGASILGYYDLGATPVDPAWYLLTMQEENR